MKTKTGFNLLTVCGEHIVIAEGEENIDFTDVISMNESSAYLWNHVTGKDFTAAEIAELLIAEYNIEKETADSDAAIIVEQWMQAGLIE